MAGENGSLWNQNAVSGTDGTGGGGGAAGKQ